MTKPGVLLTNTPNELRLKAYSSAEDRVGECQQEVAFEPEEYEGMILHALCLKVNGVYMIHCEDLQGEGRQGGTEAEALQSFLEAVDARVVDGSGGLCIRPSSFSFQIQSLLEFLAYPDLVNSCVEWGTLTQHTLQYNSADYL